MEYELILKVLEGGNIENVIKAIFSYETGIKDSEVLENMVSVYFNSKYLNSFLCEEISDIAENYYYEIVNGEE